ncbi:galactofuranosyltransferase [Prevotella sp.]|uniref:galactofuranosyltransferase n=1 Tax=Prevotella sp. TaxID=59823 RepID=UPI0026762402
MNCYLSRNYKGLGSAGNKAKTDMEKIMKDMNFRNVGLPQSISKNTLRHFFTTLFSVIKSVFCMRRGDRLVLQYPFKKYFTFVCRVAHLKNIQVIVLVHDLGSFRRKALTPEKEIRRLNHADYIIALNDSMKKWIEEHHCRAIVGTLGIWDYLSDTKAQRQTYSKDLTVVYAGALNPRKNTFLYHWGEYIHSFKVRLYGNGFEIDKAKGADKFDMMGFVKSDELIATARGHFGLVWDGASEDGCTGDWGEYLKINDPHKTSLYLRCSLPVIIWKQAALAPFISKHGIGLCVDSLKELDDILPKITPEQYAEMQANAERMGNLIAQGHFFKTALAEAERRLDEKKNIKQA